MLDGPSGDRAHPHDRPRLEAAGPARAGRRRVDAAARTLRARRYDLLVHLTEHPRGLTLARAAAAALRRHARARAARARGCGAATSRISTGCRAQRRGTRSRPTSTRCAASASTRTAPTSKLVLVPGAPRAARASTRCCAQHGAGGARLRAGASGLALAVQVLAGRRRSAALLDRIARRRPRDRDHRRARRARARAGRRDPRAASRRRRARASSTSTGALSLPELAALTARARAFVGVDSAPMHIAAAMGTPAVALFGPSGEHEWGPWQVAAARRRVRRASVPAVRPRRLRRRQGVRMPDHAAGRSACTPRSTRCSPRPTGSALMRLALIRQRYTPFGGAERFVESALEALLERNVADHALHARMAADRPAADRAVDRRSVLRRQPVARLGLRARRLQGGRRAARLDLVQSHERARVLRHLSRRRRRARGVARGAAARRVGALARLGVALEPVSPLRARHGAAAVREPVAVGGDLQLGRWCATRSATRFGVADEQAARDLQRRRLRRVLARAARASRAAARAQLRHPADATVFLLVGSGYERKGVATAIARAGGRCRRRRTSSSSARDKHLRALRAPRARRSACAAACTFAGPQPDAKPYYGAADAFVLPTLYDPLPERRAGGDGVRPAGRHQHQVRRRRARRASTTRASSATRATSTRCAAHMRALLDPALARAHGRERARARCCRCRPSAMTLSSCCCTRSCSAASVARRRRRPQPARRRRSPRATPRRRSAPAADRRRPGARRDPQAPRDGPRAAALYFAVAPPRRHRRAPRMPLTSVPADDRAITSTAACWSTSARTGGCSRSPSPAWSSSPPATS